MAPGVRKCPSSVRMCPGHPEGSGRPELRPFEAGVDDTIRRALETREQRRVPIQLQLAEPL